MYSSNGVSEIADIHKYVELVVKTEAAVPARVKHLSVESLSATSVLATWQKPSDEEGVSSYEIMHWKVSVAENVVGNV